MKPLSHLNSSSVRFVFTDIDDTLTTHGKLPAASYQALWALKMAGFVVVPITGRPAGWCDLVARFWPVDAVVGENGAFYFKYNETSKKMHREWAYGEDLRQESQRKLLDIQKEVLQQVPGARVSADQFSRLFDLAIDFCEDVPALPPSEIKKIVDVFERHGAVAKVSSIHVNGWFGNHDKLSMCRTYLAKEWNLNIDQCQELCVFTGDSPNDEPLFAQFKNSVGVANVMDFKDLLKKPPMYICQQKNGDGFVELANHLLKSRSKKDVSLT